MTRWAVLLIFCLVNIGWGEGNYLRVVHQHIAVPAVEEVPVIVTWYCLDGITRSGLPVKEGMAALNEKLLAKYPFGTKLLLANIGKVTVQDTGYLGTNPVHVDIRAKDCNTAIRNGVQRTTMRKEN